MTRRMMIVTAKKVPKGGMNRPLFGMILMLKLFPLYSQTLISCENTHF